MSANIVINVKAVTKQAADEIEKIRRKMTSLTTTKGWSDFVTGVGVGAGVKAFNVLGQAIGDIPRSAMDAVQAASDLNEAVNKSQVIFGSAATSVDEFAKSAAASMGASRTEALSAAATFGNLFNTVGLGQQDAAKMSTALLQLAGDLASFNNIGTDEALQKLRSGLVGEAEPLRAVGVLLTEASVAAKAVELGLAASTSQVSESAKVQARYALILQQTQTAQGDYARTSDGLANVQRSLDAEIKNLQADIGTSLAPTIRDLLKSFRDLVPEIKKVADGFRDAAPRAKELADALGGVDNIIQAIVVGGGIKTVITLVEALGIAIAGVTVAAAALVGGAAFLFFKFLQDLAQALPGVSANNEAFNKRLMGTKPVAEGAAASVDRLGRKIIDFGDGANRSAELAASFARSADQAGVAAGRMGTKVIDAFAGLTVASFKSGADAARSFADGLASVPGDIDSAIASLRDVAKNALSPEKMKTKLLGTLASRELARGMADKRPEVAKAALATSKTIIAALAALFGPAYAAGAQAWLQFQSGWSHGSDVGNPQFLSSVKDFQDQIDKAFQQFQGETPDWSVGTVDTSGVEDAAKKTGSLVATVRDAAKSLGGLQDKLNSLRSTFAAGWTPTVLTADQAGQALTASMGRARAALDKLRAGSGTTMTAVASAFGRMRSAASAYYDALHRQSIQSIDDARNEMNARYDAQVAQIEAGVQAMRDRQQRDQDRREEQRLRADLAAAATPDDREAARQRLDDFRAAQDIADAQARAEREIATLRSQQADENTGFDKQAANENAKFELIKSTLDAIFTETDRQLEAVKGVWDTKNKAVIAALKGFTAEYRDAGAAIIGAFVDGLASVKVPDLTAAASATITTVTEARASGGPVYAGRAYTVGEEGPETFVPRMSGTILPAGSGAGSSVTIGSINVTEATDPKATAREVLLAVKRELNRQGVSLTPASTF